MHCRSHNKYLVNKLYQLTWCPWWQYSTYGVRFPLIAKRLACMVISSETSPNLLDILSHVNLSHGIPADVSLSTSCYELVTRKWVCANSLGIKRIQFPAIKLVCFRNFEISTISQRKSFPWRGSTVTLFLCRPPYLSWSGLCMVTLTIQRPHESWGTFSSWCCPVVLETFIFLKPKLEI